MNWKEELKAIVNHLLINTTLQIDCAIPLHRYRSGEEHDGEIPDVIHAINHFISESTRLDQARKDALEHGIMFDERLILSKEYNHLRCFEGEDLDQLKEIIGEVTSSACRDDNFVLVFRNDRSKAGLPLYVHPQLIVYDIIEQQPISCVQFDSKVGNFIIQPTGRLRDIYELYDIIDMLSIGNPFPITDSILMCNVSGIMDAMDIHNGYAVNDVKSPPFAATPGNLKIVQHEINTFPVDQLFKCRDCGKTWFLSAGEAKFFEHRGLSIPKRCKECRVKNTMKRQGNV